MDELLEWPWLRFERFYSEFVLRATVERLERQQDAIIAALHGNSVFDEHEEAKRDEAVQSTQDAFSEAIEYLRARARGEEVVFDQDIDPNDPFWRPALEAEGKILPRAHGDGEGSVAEVAEGEESLRDMRKMLDSLDQT